MIHTGELIVVMSNQMLSNKEYNMLHVAWQSKSPDTLDYMAVHRIHSQKNFILYAEMNARLFRSSVLTSKATGYPLSYVTVKLTLGIALPSIKKSLIAETTVCFESSLD